MHALCIDEPTRWAHPRSLFDTGTDAFLRQDHTLMCPRFPSSTIINTAGPDKLRATEAGMLNLLVKDDKGNVHQIMLENALVVPGLSQNLTSHKQFIESGHMVFFHKNQSGIVLNKEPKFRSDDVIIPFVKQENGLYYLEEFIPEEESAVASSPKIAKIVKYRASSYSAVSYLSNVDETFI